jgi:hypothetical protein
MAKGDARRGMQYEYRMTGMISPIEMRQMGLDGWELVSVTATMYWKRVIGWSMTS